MPKGTPHVPMQARFGDDRVPVEDMPRVGTLDEPPQFEADSTTLVETRGMRDGEVYRRIMGQGLAAETLERGSDDD